MKEKLKKKLAKIKKQYYVLAGLLLVALITVVSVAIQASAFDGYRLAGGNNLIWKRDQKKASDNASLKYVTESWWFFPQKITEGDSLTRSDWEDADGFPLNTKVIDSTEVIDEMYTDTVQVQEDDLIPNVMEWVTKGISSRKQLMTGIDVYASPVYQVRYKGELKSPTYWNLNTILSAPSQWGSEWTGKAKDAIRKSYNKHLKLTFEYVSFSIKFVDEEGKPVGGFEPGKINVWGKDHTLSELENIVFFGETIDVKPFTGRNTEVTYSHYYWSDTKSGGKSIDPSPKKIDYETIQKTTAPDSKDHLILYFVFTKNVPITETPTPSVTPPPVTVIPPRKYTVTVVAEPENCGTVSGGGEYYPNTEVFISAEAKKGYIFSHWELKPATVLASGEDVADNSFMMPNADVVATAYFVPVPTSPPPPPPIVVEKYRYDNYYSSTEGHTIWKKIENGLLADTDSADGNGTLAEFAGSVGLGTTTAYSVGKDASGNEWYFTAATGAVPGLSGTKNIATYVHPKKYNGYTVDGESIKYINELTFPETITLSGTTYYVTSIGGAGSYFYAVAGSNGTFGKVEGSYARSAGASATYVSYHFGVLGNGELLSSGIFNGNAIGAREFFNNYHVYNTTLTAVTIPKYVNTILPYAFADCQALVNIYGGENVADIGKRAFSVSIVPELKFSEYCGASYQQQLENLYIYKITTMYTYDESYAFSGPLSRFTPTMLAWQQYMQIGSRMDFPSLPMLVNIGESAFENRTHLSEVRLKEKVTSIGANAFKNTTLEKIVIPSKNSKVLGGYETLGTKGYLHARPTIIETTVVDPAYAMYYGFTHHAYYEVAAGADMKYYPNGGTPNEVQIEKSGLEYNELNTVFTKKLVTTLTDHFTYVVWLGEDGYLYGGQVAGDYNNPTSSYVLKASVQLPEYKFKDVALYHNGTCYDGSYSLFRATTTDGQVLLLGVDTGKDALRNFGVFNEPSLTKEVQGVGYTIRTGNSLSQFTLVFQGEDLKLYKYVSSTKAWSSETAFPCTPAATAVKNTGNSTGSYTCGVIGTDGTLWRKSSFTGTWSKLISGLGEGATLLYDDAATLDFYLCQANGSVYDFKYSAGSYQLVAKSAVGVTTIKTHKKGDSTLYVGRGADGSLYAKYDAVDAYTQATATSGWVRVAEGAGEFLGAYNVNEGVIVYGSDQNGCIRGLYFDTFLVGTKYDFTVVTTNITLAYGSEFAQIIVLGAQEEQENYTEEFNGNTDTYNFANTGALRVAALDKAGYLWFGFCDEKEDDMFRVSDKVYTDMMYKEVSYESFSERSQYDDDGDGTMNYDEPWYIKKNSISHVNYIYLRDAAGDIYSVVDNKYIYYREYPCPIDEKQDYLYETTYGNATSITPVLMPYEKNVTEFLSFPYIWFEDGTVGNLITTNLKYDIFAGVTFTAVVSPNRWFRNEGKQFTGWNTAAGGTGTAYAPGTVIEMGSFDAAWKNNLSNLGMSFYAQWTNAGPQPHYIHYDSNGGAGFMASTEVPAGTTTATLAANLYTKDGHRFTGWNTREDGRGTSYPDRGTVTGITEDITVYAQWEPYTYTLQLAHDEIRVTPVRIDMSAELTFAEEVGLPGEPYDKNSTVRYNTNLTTQSTRALFAWVTAQPLSDTYTKADAPFDGWTLYRKESGSYTYLARRFDAFEVVSGLTTIDRDVLTLFPVWSGGYVRLPDATLPGYTLEAWMDAPTEASAGEIAYLESEADGEGGFYAPRLNEETLYALWTPNRYKVNLVSDYEGSSVTTLGGTTGDTFVWMTFDAICPSVTTPTLPRYVFKGYYTEPNGQGTMYYGPADRNTGVSAAYNNKVWTIYDGSVDTLYAYWVPDKAITYEPNYSPLNAGCRPAWTEYIDTSGSYWTLAANEFTRLGYRFMGWNRNADGSGTSYADRARIATANIDGIVPLYAQWNPITYTVQYAPDEIGENPVIPVPGPGDVWVYDREYTIKNRPFEKYDNVSYDLNRQNKSTVPYMVTVLTDEHTKSVYRFVGWELYEKTANGYTDLQVMFEEGEVVSNLTAEEGKAFVLFPVWEEIPDGVTLPVAACTGYRFRGWTEQRIADSMIGAGRVLTSPYITRRTPTGNYTVVNGHRYLNQVLYAYWTPEQYLVILDDRGATSTGHTEEVLMTFDQLGPDIIVPEKTGYTFHGYYTEIKGAGTKYYDETGICVKTWTETDVYVLYAYWTQNPVEPPEEEEFVEPTILPEKVVEGSIGNNKANALLYADDYNAATGALDDLQPYLTYDTPGAEGVIPGTEFLSFRARMGSWMLNYKFHRYSGKDMVRFLVTVTYRTQYELPNEELVISDLQFKEYSILVPKAWSYWTVAETGMYYPDKVTIENEALKDGVVTVPVNRDSEDAPQPPEYTVTNLGNKDAHVRWEEYDTDGVPLMYLTLEEEAYIISTRVNELPDVDRYLTVLCKNAARNDKRQAEARSDSFIFEGETILSDEWLEQHGAELDEEKIPADEELVKLTIYPQTYQSGIELDEKKLNGTYATTAVITYVGDEKNVGADPTKEIPLADINGLNIHTPVACDGVAVDGIEDGVLTLKDALNFFTLRIDNTGTHRMNLGYGTKDFSFALSGKSNVAERDGSYLNQVKFPFDVYVDMGTDSLNPDGTYSTAGDYYFEAGTWLTISNQDKRFYVPVTQEEGEYEISFRTIAVNCPIVDGEYAFNTVQRGANIEPLCYAASDSMTVNLVLSLQNFEIINTNDPSAKTELDAGNQALVLKKGYKFGYKLSTMGTFISNDCETRIVPTYYYISKDGKERVEADIYYNEVISGQKKNLVLVGDGVDLSNIHKVKNNSAFLAIPNEVLGKTQELSGISPFIGISVDMYTYKSILLNMYVKMFTGLDVSKLPVKYCPDCHFVYCEGESVTCGHTLNDTTLYTMAEKIAQEWYGEFALPMDSYVLVKGTKTGYCDICNTNRYVIGESITASCGHGLSNIREFDLYSYAMINTISGNEEFFKQDGYLAVSFEIQAKADSGEWYAFKNWPETELYNDFKGKARYVQGDVVWYDLSKSSGDDYEVGGVE